MEINSYKTIESFRYHIHNYSQLAIKSLILEVQKYPIIFTSDKVVFFRKELVEFAWTKITISLLDTAVPTYQKVALINVEYGKQSFKQLWKFMINIYMKQKSNPMPRTSCREKYQWLGLMKFLDPHIKNIENLPNYCDIDSQFQSKLRLEILPSETKTIDLDPGNHIILWVRKFSESSKSKKMCISVCMEFQRCLSPPLPMGVKAMLEQEADIDESQLLLEHVNSPACVVFRQPQSQLSHLLQRNVPQIVPFEMVIDKDYMYIMSLYPKFARLQPARKPTVKKLMLLAVIDAL